MFFNIATPKFAAQAIKKVAEIDWKPLHFLNNVSASIGGVIKPAGFENAQGIISSAYLKDPTDPQWKNDPGMKDFERLPGQVLSRKPTCTDAIVIYGYTVAQTMVQVLKQCGDDLTRANVMKQAASLKNLELGGLLPGIKINTSATDFAPIVAAAADDGSRARPGSCSATSSAAMSAADALRPVAGPMTTKEAAPAALSQGLFVVSDPAKWYSMRPSRQELSIKKAVTHIIRHQQGET